MNKKKVLITGDSGFIGSNMVDFLLTKDMCVYGFSLDYPFKKYNYTKFNNENYHPIFGDIVNYIELKKAIDSIKPQIIIHLAAQAIVGDSLIKPNITFDINIKGTWNLLNIAKECDYVERIIIASSDKAYGSNKKLPYKEDYELKAIYPYEISKRMTEEIAMSYYNTFNVPIIVTRCVNVFGPQDLHLSRVIPYTIKSCLLNEEILLRSNGRQKRSYLYIKDAINAYYSLITAPIENVKGQVFNIGNDEMISVLEIVQLICQKMNNDFINNVKVLDTAKYEIKEQFVDNNKIYDLLGWKTEYKLDLALNETILWYQSNIKIFT